jgi:lysophospholipase L1-like esterase
VANTGEQMVYNRLKVYLQQKKLKFMNFWGLIFILLIVILVLSEIFLRLYFGFGNPLLYIADDQIGYLLVPNQQTHRFGNFIYINKYSMRSPEITPKTEANTLRILLIGDSIANGGWWTDQSQILSERIKAKLQSKLVNSQFKSLEVLNASANSWGPRNQLAYLQKYGIFHAQTIILLLNTDDLFGTAPTSIPVGKDINYPVKKPVLGMIEFLSRLLPYKPPKEMEIVQQEGGDRVGFNLDAITKINAFAQENNCKFLLAMTPLVREVIPPGPRDYEIKARARLTALTEEKNITYLDFLPIFTSYNQPEQLFRDNIHLSAEGDQLVSAEISKLYEKLNFN